MDEEQKQGGLNAKTEQIISWWQSDYVLFGVYFFQTISFQSKLGAAMRVATEHDKERILQYLRANVQECLYLYMDITNYGIASDNMKVWLAEEKGELSLVAMKYYDSYQIYSHRKDGDLTDLCQLLQTFPASMISGRKDLIEELAGNFPDYKASYGIVFHAYPCESIKNGSFHIVQAVEKDAEEIAKFLCADKCFGAQYKESVLKAQLEERIHTRTGRSYFIRDKETNEIIAHYGTFAETQDIAILSGCVVVPDYRKTDIFQELDSYARYQLGIEHKDLYAFATAKRITYRPKMLHMDCGEYGKLVK